MKNDPGTERSPRADAKPVATRRDASDKRFFVKTRVKAGPHFGTLSGHTYDFYAE